MKICQVEKPLVATNRIPGLEHKHMQVVRDGSARLVAVDAVGCIPGVPGRRGPDVHFDGVLSMMAV